VKPTVDGFLFIDPARIAADVATGLPPEQADDLAHFIRTNPN